jgi:peptide/nickel transport system permease protein
VTDDPGPVATAPTSRRPTDAEPAPPPADLDHHAVPRRGRVLHRFARHRLGVASAAFIALLAVVAILAPLVAPKDPNAQDLLNRLQPPSGEAWLGTDDYGRDQLSRLIYGTRISLLIGIGSMVVAFAIGVPPGVIAGFRGGKVDAVLGRVNDALLALPALLFFFVIIAVLGRGLATLCVAIGIFSSTAFFRVARSSTQSVTQETHIESARALGATTWRIVVRHIVPNILSPLMVLVSIGAGVAVTAEASLSFLGLGVEPPTASWGSMLASGSEFMRDAPVMIYAPSVMIALTVMSFGFVGDGLRAAVGTTQTVVSEGPR